MFQPTADAVVANRYRLIREIGRGGMGAVWEAYDLELEAPCALKFILNQHNKPPETRSRFLREARSVARLQSPHVVSIRSVGEWEEALYIAMELLAGETLFDRLTRTRTLSARDTSRLVDQIASVLRVAHSPGIVHRDLKPENVWLWSEGDLFVKLLDFGVAKQVLDSSHALKTATGVLIGTPNYMSPEQAAGDRHVDHRSDLWSLALIAAECLSGRRTFQTSGLGQLLATIINGPTPDIKGFYPSASPALEQWWARATAKDPAARYDSASNMAEELALALGVRTAGASLAADQVHIPRPELSADSQPTVTSSLSPVVAPPPTTQALAEVVEVWPVPRPSESPNVSPEVAPSPNVQASTLEVDATALEFPAEVSPATKSPPSKAWLVAALALVGGGIGWFTWGNTDTPEHAVSPAATQAAPQVAGSASAPKPQSLAGTAPKLEASASSPNSSSDKPLVGSAPTSSAQASPAPGAPSLPNAAPASSSAPVVSAPKPVTPQPGPPKTNVSPAAAPVVLPQTVTSTKPPAAGQAPASKPTAKPAAKASPALKERIGF